MINEYKQYGYVKPAILEDHYILGDRALPIEFILPSGDWTPFLPSYEPQFNDEYDTYGCTVWGSENQIETYLKFLTKIDWNFSERYIYILVGIRPPGRDPNDTYEVIRSYGLIEDAYLPMTQTYDEFLKPSPMSLVLKKKGKEFLEDWDFKHEWLWKSRLTREKKDKILEEMLKCSPIAISVTAWYANDDGEYIDKGKENNHWCLLYKMDKQGRKYVFDSYDQTTKILSAHHDIDMAKRILIKRKVPSTNRLRQLMELLAQALKKAWTY